MTKSKIRKHSNADIGKLYVKYLIFLRIIAPVVIKIVFPKLNDNPVIQQQ